MKNRNSCVLPESLGLTRPLHLERFSSHFMGATVDSLQRRQVELHKLLPSLSTEKRVKSLQVCEHGPSARRVKEVCGSCQYRSDPSRRHR